jgi:Uma2 family endonuclease
MAPIGPSHAWCVANLIDLLGERLRRAAVLWVQSPLHISERSEPQPDLTLVRRGTSHTAHPRPEDILLVIEVADSSLAYDRDVKAALYARAGIPEFWLVDVKQRRISIFRDPGPSGYQSIFQAQGNEPISPLAFPSLRYPAEQIFQ